MDELKDARLYGGIGAILSSFGLFVPYLGVFVSIVGFVLEILAVDKISHALNDKEIFNNYLISLVLMVIGVVSAILFGIVVFGITIIRTMPMLREGKVESIFPLLGAIFIVLFVLWVASIVSAIFLKKSFDLIAKKLNVSLFSTTALLYLIGAATVILAVGFLIMFVANILKIVAYFSIPENITPSSTQPPPQVQTA